MSFYVIEVTAGSYSWTVRSDTPPDLTDSSWLADDFRLSWAYPAGTSYPAAVEPVTARLGLVTIDAAELADLAIGTPVSVLFHVQEPALGDAPAATFHGRIAEMTANPVRFLAGDPAATVDGLLYTLELVDYSVDLTGVLVGLTDWPAEDIEARLSRIWAAAELTEPVMSVTGGTRMLAARPAALTTAAEALEDVLRQSAGELLGGKVRTVLAPAAYPGALAPFGYTATGALTTSQPLYMDWVPAAPFRVVLVVDPTGTDPDTASTIVLDAATVDRAADWKRDKTSEVNFVSVTGPFDGLPDESTVSVQNGDADPWVPLALSVTLTDSDDALELGTAYLPDDPGTPWMVDKFLWYADLAPDLLRPGSARFPWFPNHGQDPDTFVGVDQRAYGISPVVIDGIPTSQNPDGPRTWYAGTASSAELRVRDRRYSLEFTLRREVGSDTDTTTGLTCADIAADTDLDTALVSDVDPSIRVYDLRLVRGTS